MKQFYTIRQKIAGADFLSSRLRLIIRAALVSTLLCAQIGTSGAAPARKNVEAPRGQKEIEPLQGTRGLISQTARINFSDLAERERINPPVIR